MGSNLSDYKKQDLCFFLSAAAILLINLWKCRIGIGSSDEHFYITLGYRLFQGDALFYDDWHIAQMIGVFIAPLVAIYHAFAGSMDEIVLFMRVMYSVFTLAVGLAFYFRFRKYGIRAAAAAILYMLFTPFNIMALSYNTMSVGFLIFSSCIFPEDGQNKVMLALSGLLFSWAVLNTPYLAFLYIGFTIYALVRHQKYKKTWLYFSSGVLLAAGVFLALVFSRESFSQMMDGISHLIDPSHSSSPLLLFAKNGARLILIFRFLMIGFIVELILAFRYRDRKDSQKQQLLNVSAWFNLAAVIYVSLIHTYRIDTGGYVVLLVPFALTGLLEAILFPQDQRIRICFFLSLFHALMLAVSSNVGPASFCGPLISACATTILMNPGKLSLRNGISVLSASAMILLMFFKVTVVYGGSGNYEIMIQNGPLKGLYDSRETADSVAEQLADIQTINAEPGETADLITWNVWEYLALEKRIATNSTYLYFWEKDEYTEAQNEYFQIHSDKLPVLVYLDLEPGPYDLTAEDSFFKSMKIVKKLNQGVLLIGE